MTDVSVVAAAVGGAPPGSTRRPASFLESSGEMARLIRDFDWSKGPLGPIEGWPQSLRTVVRLLLNSHHPMYVFWGPDHICLWNDAYTASIGPERHPVSLGRPGKEVWCEIWEIIGPQIDHVMAGRGATWNVNQLVPITRHGRRDEVYWTYGYSPIDDDASPDGVGGVLVVCNETTDQVMAERRLAEQALTRGEERDRLARLFEQAPSFMALLTGPDHRYALVNQAYKTLLGDRDFLGKTVAEVVPEAVGQGYISLLDRVFRSGESHKDAASRLELQGRAGQAVEHFIDFIYEPVRDETGVVVGIFVEGFDTTARTLAERELERAGRLLRSVIETSPGAIYFKDREGRMRLANAAVLNLIGKPWDEVDGKTDEEFLDDPAEGRAIMENDRRILAGRTTQQLEERAGTVDGCPRLFLSTKSPLLGDDGEVLGLVGVSIDITSRKRLETQLHELNANLEAQVLQRTAALEEAAQALRQSQKMEAIGQLTGGIAHDFNNMLQGVIGGISLAKRRIMSNQPEQADRYLDGAADAAARAAALTARLLAFGRRQSLDARPVDLEQLLRSMAELIARTTGPSIDVELQLKSGCRPVLVDRNQLESALLNLCINARDAMPSGGRLVIGLDQTRIDATQAAQWGRSAAGDYVCISVADTGVGMGADVLAHAFEPFFTTKAEGQGTGLGLSQIYGFVRQSHGGVRLDSAPGQGAMARIFLPACPADAAEAAPPPCPGPFPGAPAPKTWRILLVEDEESIRGPSSDALRELGYEVEVAVDGGEALGILGASDAPAFDLLLTDVGLPGGINGRQLAEAARERTPHIPVLLITGYGGDAIVGRARLEPGMEILAKPFDLGVLATRVRRILDRESAVVGSRT